MILCLLFYLGGTLRTKPKGWKVQPPNVIINRSAYFLSIYLSLSLLHIPKFGVGPHQHLGRREGKRGRENKCSFMSLLSFLTLKSFFFYSGSFHPSLCAAYDDLPLMCDLSRWLVWFLPPRKRENINFFFSSYRKDSAWSLLRQMWKLIIFATSFCAWIHQQLPNSLL